MNYLKTLIDTLLCQDYCAYKCYRMNRFQHQGFDFEKSLCTQFWTSCYFCLKKNKTKTVPHNVEL